MLCATVTDEGCYSLSKHFFFVMTKKTPTLSDLQTDGFESALRDQHICNCEQGAEPKGKAFEFPVHLCSNPHLRTRAAGSDRKNEIAGASSQNVLVFWARLTRRRPRGWTRTHWRDYISHLAWVQPRYPPGGAGKHCSGRGMSGAPFCADEDEDEEDICRSWFLAS